MVVSMEKCNKFISAISEFYKNSRNDENGRFRSWEHCYKNFYKARSEKNPDVDHLSLHLSFYLASWGMYRGSSFLLEKDYRVHIPAINKILCPKYDVLLGADYNVLLEEDNQALLWELSGELEEYYKGIRSQVKGVNIKNPVSKTLITKILMGTLGCVPAYDEYFIKGIVKEKVAKGTYNKESIKALASFYERYNEKLDAERCNWRVEDIEYPQMKLLDMGFWQMGKDITKK